jgi:hypothetical protein
LQANVGLLLITAHHCSSLLPTASTVARLGAARSMGPKRLLDVNGDEQEKKRERGGYTPELKVKLIDMVKSSKYSSNAAALAAFNKQYNLEVKANSMSVGFPDTSRLGVRFCGDVVWCNMLLHAG